MSGTHVQLLIPDDRESDRLDKWLAESLPQYSREYLKGLIQAGQVSVCGKPCTKPAFTLETGQTVELTIPEPVALDLSAEAIPLDICFEDDHLLVVNKPSGMLTHPSGASQTGTLVNALLHHCHGQLSGINGVERPGIVHRLDRETSGLLMVAKSDAAHQSLQAQIQARTAKRQYRAIVQGEMPQPSGTVSAPIGRHPKKRELMAVVPDGRDAVTHWQVLETIGRKASVLELTLETGRTHQIRVHMAHVQHPIFADPAYGSGLAQQLKFAAEGQILQAFRLSLAHPLSGEPLTFELPPDEKFERAYGFLHAWMQ